MNLATLLATTVLLLMSAGICFADTLVITYSSGKTQTVTLDEPSTTINSWQFVGGNTAVHPSQKQIAPQQESTKTVVGQPVKEDKKVDDKAQDKKTNVRFKWNAPPIRE